MLNNLIKEKSATVALICHDNTSHANSVYDPIPDIDWLYTKKTQY